MMDDSNKEENFYDDLSEDLNTKLNDNFAGRIVRKDLTKKIKEGAKSQYTFLNIF
jgi:ATP-dependent Lon protease